MLLLAVVVLTSVAAWALLRRGRPGNSLALAAGKALECLGLALGFLVADVAVGVLLILALRGTGRFVSIYVMSDPALLVLALVQALVLQHWKVEPSSRGPC